MKVGIVDLNAVNAQQLVTESLIESGFAVVENHKIPVSELNKLYEIWNNFFLNGNPGQYVTDVESQAGYFSPYFAETAKGHEAQDLKEYFHYWPGGMLPAPVEKMTLHYYDAIFNLGKDVMAWLQANSPTTLWQAIDQPFEQYLSRNQTLLRILRYPPLTGNEPPEVNTCWCSRRYQPHHYVTPRPASPGCRLNRRVPTTGYPSRHQQAQS